MHRFPFSAKRFVHRPARQIKYVARIERLRLPMMRRLEVFGIPWRVRKRQRLHIRVIVVKPPLLASEALNNENIGSVEMRWKARALRRSQVEVDIRMSD